MERALRSCRVAMIAIALIAACSSEEPSVAPTTATAPTVGSTTTSVAPAEPTSPPTSDVATTIATTTTTTATIVSTTVATTTVTTTPTTTAAPVVVPTAEPTDETVLVYGGGPGDGVWQRLGAWDGRGWIDLADDEPYGPATIDSVSVASVDLLAVAADVPYSMPDYACVDAALHVGLDPALTLPESPLGWGYGGVAVNADWPLQPRPVRAVGVDADVYQEVGERLLTGRSDVDPTRGDVVQVLRADLDGDGTEEVLVGFRYLSAPDFGAAGDFSIVYLRRIAAGGTVDDEIVFEYVVPELGDPPFPSPGRGSVAAVADLNGDGVMEVAIGSSYWEYAQIDVYAFENGSLRRVVSGGCGV